MTEKTIDAWTGCYPSRWKGLIVEGAFAHPAKFSNKLILKIYDHILAEGWVRPGDTIVDPFGGVGLGALDAMRLGLNWRGCELEDRFVKLGNENIRFWNNKFGSMPKWSGDAVLLQGDSRLLSQVLCQAHTAVSSPPFSDVVLHNGGPVHQRGGELHSSYTATVSSPPFSDVLSRDRTESVDRRELADKLGISNTEHISPIEMEKIGKRNQQTYGGLDTSPPYAETRITETGDYMQSMGRSHEERYGPATAQLGTMKSTKKGFQASVTSPPFQATTGGVHQMATEGPLAEKGLYERHAAGNMNAGYGDTEGNMGSASNDDFWMSARVIVEQVFVVLEPGAHAVWVVKDYVKNKERVPFCAQWQQMCEAVGFVTLHEHHALLVRHKGISTTDMDGKVISHEVSSKSFFRRLAEKKGSPKIDYEVVLCMVKPI